MTDRDCCAQPERDDAPDRDLVRRIRSCGDTEAKDALFQRHRREVERIIAGELKHARRVEVEDLSQEVWITVWEKLGTWKGENECLLPWIRTIARHKAQDYGRRIREVLCDGEDDMLDPRRAPQDPERAALSRIAQARLLEALDLCMGCLSDVEYLAFSAMLTGDSLKDLAEDLGKERNAVDQDLHRAREKVRTQMRRHYSELLPEDVAGETPRKKRGRAR